MRNTKLKPKESYDQLHAEQGRTRQRRQGPLRDGVIVPRVTTPERFWEQVSIRWDGECWPWLGRCDEKGYGRVGYASKASRKAHRVAWETRNGSIPDGAVICHSCDNPACCNPAHLFLGTQLDNIADRERKGRGASPPSRAKLTDKQVRAVRAEYRRGLSTQQALAERYGVSRGNLSKILNGRLYAHVQ